MFRHRNARPAALLLMVLAVALLWAADPGLRATARDRAEAVAPPSGGADQGKALASAPQKADKSATTGKSATSDKSATGATPAPAPKAAQQGKPIVPTMTPREMMERKIKPAQRQAAADAIKAKKNKGAGPAPTFSTLEAPSALVAALSPALSPTVPSGGLITDSTGALVPDYLGGVTPNWAFSPQPYMCTANPAVDPPECAGLALGTVVGTGIRKFVDSLPDLTGLIAKPDTVTYPGTDYYEIELFEGSWTFHTDLSVAPFAPSRLRMYRQTNHGTVNDPVCTPQPACQNTAAPPPAGYLGPVIIASRDRPTRIKLMNSLPTGSPDGDLFIPTDTTVMGAGTGYDLKTGSVGTYPQNRGTLHLHGGFTPWVSDGTPHQWVTPAGEPGNLTTGVSTQPVPDMALPAGDSMTFYWPNQQSGRLMFYHDHAYGITRLNVYAGEAAGYLLVDPVERELTAGDLTKGVCVKTGSVCASDADCTSPDTCFISPLPAMPDIPLVIQDKTFVWGTPPVSCASGGGTGTWATDPTWCDPLRHWRQTPGSLWFPHVYMPNQNPADVSGVNAMGRWDYALWFWPPYNGMIANGLVQDPYGPSGQMIPGTPNPSLVPEAFMDTPIVNGKAYPTLTVPAGPVRLRILNAANDRFQNLSLFVAADNTTRTTSTVIPGLPTAPTVLCTTSQSAACTEVKMVPFNSSTPGGFPLNWYSPGNPIVFDDRAGGVPDPATRGPAMIQIGTEGGLLPAPAVVLNQPINFTYNTKNIVVLSVQEHALFLGPAERADVIVDFSAFAGGTLILYNDSPAPVPAYDQRLDYFTGGGGVDQTGTGGTRMTLPGYGPNTRTIMRIRVGAGASAPSPDYVNTSLCTPVAPVAGVPGPVGCSGGALATLLPAAFRASQDPIIVPQKAYDAAYGTTTTDAAGVNVSRIQDTSLTFVPLAPTCLPGTTNAANPCVPTASATNFPMLSKAIQELFELDYGRMNATLGIELPKTTANIQTTLPMGYIEPPTEILSSATAITPPSSADDGTQIWKITHNGVDTHAIHVHLFNVQVINRVGWDGAIRQPDLNELGWKETVRMNPLEDIIVALRPTTPKLPFGLPDSERYLAPTLTPLALINTFNVLTGNPMTVPNALYNFGWEYVWHCHLLGHEENDMMRPTVFLVPSSVPEPPEPATGAKDAGPSITVKWADLTPIDYGNLATDPNLGNSKNEIGFRIERSVRPCAIATCAFDPYTPVGTAPANATSFTDASSLVDGTAYKYRITAYNAAGSAVAETGEIGYAGSGVTVVTFTGAPARAAYHTSFTVTATTSSAVMPTITPVGTCTVGPVGGSSTSATALVTMTGGTGSCSLTADWAANAPYAAGTASQTTVAMGAVPTVAILGVPGSAVFNTSFAVTATTNASTTPTITGTGACVYGPTPGSPASILMTSGTGTCSLTASWAADTNYASATASKTTTAALAAPTVTFTAPAVAGLYVPFLVRATTNASTMPTIAWISGVGCSVGPVSGTPASSTASVTMTSGAGACSFTASWAADTNYTAATLARSTTPSVLIVAPALLSFGSQLLGTASATKTVILNNTGTTAVTLTSVTVNAPFARNGGTCLGSLAAGRTCTIGIRFTPLATGPAGGQLVVVNSDPGSPHTAVLSGDGIAPVASAAPAALTFSTGLSVPSASQPVIVTNTGTAPLTITGVTRTGLNASQFSAVNGCPISPLTLAVGASCTINVTFLPTAASPITKTATLNVVVKAPATNATVALTGNIIVPTFTVAPSPVAFGNMSVAGGVKTIPVTVTNTSLAPLRITSITRTGGLTTQFPPPVNPPVASGGCPISPLTLAAGASCTVTAQFNPTTAGLKATILVVNVGAPGVSLSVLMSGTGILP